MTNIEKIKQSEYYNIPLINDNEQLKKKMDYDIYLNNFLVEEVKDLPSITEKIAVFNTILNAMEQKGFKVGFSPETKILDIRTKDGQFVHWLYLNLPDARLGNFIGFEMVKEWADYAQVKGRSVAHHKDFTKLPFDDNEFDIVYSYRTFGRVEDNLKFFSELFRVSKNLLFLLVDDMSRDRNLQYATTYDIRSYIQKSKKLNGHDLILAGNPVTNMADEKIYVIYKKECGGGPS